MKWPFRDSGGYLVVLSDILKDPISSLAGLLHIPGLQRKSQALGGGIGFMHCQMAPPDTTIVPKMMVRVLMIDP